MTDKLITYLNYRITRYKDITVSVSESSNYYQIGEFIIRISDHIKYGLSSQKTYDYCFIIQPNDTYLFYLSPLSSSKTCAMMTIKTITLQEAKSFIKKLHDYIRFLNQISNHYCPDNWNIITPYPKSSKYIIEDDEITEDETLLPTQLSWNEFCEKYIDKVTNDKKINILDHIEAIYSQFPSKGKLDQKMKTVPEIYNNLTKKQYRRLIFKLEHKK